MEEDLKGELKDNGVDNHGLKYSKRIGEDLKGELKEVHYLSE